MENRGIIVEESGVKWIKNEVFPLCLWENFNILWTKKGV